MDSSISVLNCSTTGAVPGISGWSNVITRRNLHKTNFIQSGQLWQFKLFFLEKAVKLIAYWFSVTTGGNLNYTNFINIGNLYQF